MKAGHWQSWIMCAALTAWVSWVTGSGLVRLWIGTTPDPWYVKPFTELFDRFEPLRGTLPMGVVVGYASPFRPDDTTARWRQYVARYALTPLILDETDGHRFVLADFTSEEALTIYVKRARGVLRAHPEPGLGLVERPEFTP